MSSTSAWVRHGPEEGIRVVAVAKRFGPVEALSGIDIVVAPGRILALLGPNGAGKSTLIRILAAGLLPDAGSVHVGGVDALVHPRRARGRLGLVLAEERSFFWRLTGLQNLTFFAALHGARRAEAIARSRRALELVGMGAMGDRRVDRYSTGMKAKLSIARAVLGDPVVLLLDEPTRSLDPIATIETRTLVQRLARQGGAAVLFATHDLHEAAAIADEVAVAVHGSIVRTLPGGSDAAALESALVDATGVSPSELTAEMTTADDPPLIEAPGSPVDTGPGPAPVLGAHADRVDRRVRPFGVVAACIRRDAAEAWSYRFPFVWSFFEIFTGLFMLYFLSRLVGHRIVAVEGSHLTGGYFGFAVLGTGLVAILHGSMTAFSSRLRADQTTGTLEAMLSTPSPAWLTIVAGSAYGIVQIVAAELVAITAAVAVFGMQLHATLAGFIVLVPGLVAMFTLFASLGLMVTSFTVVFKRGQGVATLLISAFTLLGGVYYPISLLPASLRSLGAVLPFTWALDLVRGSLVFGQAPWARLSELVVADAVLVPLAIWLLGRAVDRTRRSGTLSQY